MNIVALMTKHLHTVDDVIEWLGGTGAVTELMKYRNPSTVSMWKTRNRLPPTTFLALQFALRDTGATAPASLWGMMEHEAA